MATPETITMQMVADAVGLSRSAVSLALRNHPSIPSATRARVAEAARRLGYRPNPLVAALMSQHLRLRPRRRRPTIAYVTTHPPDDPWRNYAAFVQMHDGVVRRAAELGYRVEEFALARLQSSPARLIEILRARGINGIFLAPLPGSLRTLDLDITDFATVGLGMSVSEPVIRRVTADIFQVGRLAAQRCAELGYRRIGFAASAAMSSRLEDRMFAGYRQGLWDCGLAETVPPLLTPPTAPFATFLPAWCRTRKPEVVLFGTFDAGCLRAVPPEIGCVNLNVDTPRSDVTGVYQDQPRIGAMAAEQLHLALQQNATGPLDQPQTYLHGGAWVVGRTASGVGVPRSAGH
jgi:DNA-binding LacI/PurR family transcriptional regulator